MSHATVSGISTAAHADEAAITIRPIRPEDEMGLRVAFARLSAESRYARFRGVVCLSDAQWKYLTRVDGRDHVALVAVTRTGEIVGVARFVRLDTHAHGTKAEAAFTIADAYQNRGLGHALLEELLPIARARHVRTLVAYAAATNFAMARLFASHGGRSVAMHEGEAVLELDTAARVHAPVTSAA